MTMDYKEALKKVSERKSRDNFIIIELDYSKKLILPYKDGIAFLATLASAEQLNDRYGSPKTIVPLEADAIKTTIMSATEYEQIKIAALLNVTVDEVKSFALQAA